MRILFLTFYFEPDLCAGSFRNTPLFKELLNQLTPKDFVHVVTTHPNRYKTFQAEGATLEEGENFRINRIRIPKHKSGFTDQAKSFRVFYKEALKITKTEKYDLVYASSSRLFTAFLGRRIASIRKIPLYLDIRDIFVDTMKDIFKDKKYIQLPIVACLKQIEKYTFSKADHINLVSEGFQRYFQKYSFPVYSFFTNGIDEVFLNLPPTDSVKVGGLPVITYAGNIGSGQGLEKIIPDIAARLEGRYLFRVIGDGGTRILLEQAIAAKHLSNVEILNPMSRAALIEEYQKADFLFLHLNDLEAFEKVLPSKIFEYAVFNKPIIAGVKGYARQFILDNLKDSIVFDPTDAEDLFRKLEAYRALVVSHEVFVRKFSRQNIMWEMAHSIISTFR